MPLYEYHCNVCEIIFERLQLMGSNGLVVCDRCGSEASRILSVVASYSKSDMSNSNMACESSVPAMPGCGSGGCGAC